MKSKRAFLFALVANVAPLSLCFLYRNGAPLLFSLFPLIHILLFLLNHSAAKTMFQTVLLGLIHIAVTICTHQRFGWLYLQYVFFDVEGKAIVTMGTLVGAIWTTILLVVSVILFRRRKRRMSALEGQPKRKLGWEIIGKERSYMAEYKTPDEETKARDHYEEMSGMRFRSVKIQFYPEDLAKMETMEHKEKMDYVRWLRQENRYVEVDDEPEEQ